MRTSNVVLLIVALASGYSALVKHNEFAAQGDPSAAITPERQQKIRQAVNSTRRDIQDCIANNPSDWCNRDRTDAQLYAFHSRMHDKFNPADGPRQARNRYLIFALIAGAILAFRLRAKNGSPETSA